MDFRGGTSILKSNKGVFHILKQLFFSKNS